MILFLISFDFRDSLINLIFCYCCMIEFKLEFIAFWGFIVTAFLLVIYSSILSLSNIFNLFIFFRFICSMTAYFVFPLYFYFYFSGWFTAIPSLFPSILLSSSFYSLILYRWIILCFLFIFSVYSATTTPFIILFILLFLFPL